MNSVPRPFPLHGFLCPSPHGHPGPNVFSCSNTCTQAVPPRPARPGFAPAFLLASGTALSQPGWKKEMGLGRQKGSISSKPGCIPLLGVTSFPGVSGDSLPSPAQPQPPSLTPIISQPPLAPQISPYRAFPHLSILGAARARSLPLPFQVSYPPRPGPQLLPGLGVIPHHATGASKKAHGGSSLEEGIVLCAPQSFLKCGSAGRCPYFKPTHDSRDEAQAPAPCQA